MKTAALFCFLILLCLSGRAWAHPETGLLPDAIAETEYKIVLEINPRDFATKTKLAMVLYRKNKLREAESHLAEVLKNVPRDFDANDVMGLIRLKQDRPSEALAWFQKAIEYNSEDTMVHYSLGRAYEQLGRFREAESSYRKGLETNDRLLRKGINRTQEVERKNLLETALQGVRQKLKGAR